MDLDSAVELYNIVLYLQDPSPPSSIISRSVCKTWYPSISLVAPDPTRPASRSLCPAALLSNALLCLYVYNTSVL